MADFSYNQLFVYAFDDRELAGINPADGTLNDVDDDNTFEADDTGGLGFGHVYAGTVTIQGVKMPVFESEANNTVWVFNPSSTDFSTSQLPDPIPAAMDEDFSFCFAKGTRITTPTGDIAVEDAQIGDLLLSARGLTVQVKWIGKQTLFPAFSGSRMQPVRIRAGALGNGLPHDDLTVTADHGMIIDGLVINASALVNGDSIDFVPMNELGDGFTVYHIETEDHDVILANGAPAETFMDSAGRRAFDNHQDYLDLYGAERLIPEMDRPRIASARLLPQGLKDRLGLERFARAG